jgi:hypothetical protein
MINVAKTCFAYILVFLVYGQPEQHSTLKGGS